jgi:hypothetical protein
MTCMDLQEMNNKVKAEMDTLKPAGLSEQEQGVWLASFSSIRLADLSRGEPLGSEVVVMEATAQAILSAHCDPISSMVVSADNKIVTLVCSNPNSNTQNFLNDKRAVFPLWDFSVTSIEAPNGVHEKVVFQRRAPQTPAPTDAENSQPPVL